MTKKYRILMLFVTLVISFTLPFGCQKAKEKASEVKDKAAETAGAVTEKVSEKTDMIKEKAAEAKDKVVEISGDVTETAAESAEAITKKAIEAKDKTVEITGDITDKASETAREIKETTAQAATELSNKVAETSEASKEKVAEKLAGTTMAITPASREYVGVNKCKACHLKQYKSWKKTKMAMSFENLKPGVNGEAKKKAGIDPGKDYTQDTTCVRCHTTGYGKGGFVNMQQTPNLINVQCESCHGPGSDYRVIMKNNKKFALIEVRQAGLINPSEDERGCLECHGTDSPFNEKVDPKYKFDIKERLKNTHDHFPLKYQH